MTCVRAARESCDACCLEVLYDADLAAREQVEAAGLAYIRTESLNVMPPFIVCLTRIASQAAKDVE